MNEFQMFDRIIALHDKLIKSDLYEDHKMVILFNKLVDTYIKTNLDNLHNVNKEKDGTLNPVVEGKDNQILCVDNGNLEAGDYSIVRANFSGNVLAKNNSVVFTSSGFAGIRNNGLAAGTSIRIGKNSVGVLLHEDGELKSIIINSKTLSKNDVLFFDQDTVVI